MSEKPVSLFRNFVPEPPERHDAPDRLQLSSEFLFPIVLDHGEELEWFRQLNLQSESEFITWVRRIGVDAWSGYPNGDAEKLWSRGWLRADEAAIRHMSRLRFDEEPEPIQSLDQSLGIQHKPAGRWKRHDLTFHPFRMLPLMKVLEMMDWRLTRTSVLYGKGLVDYSRRHVNFFRSWIKNPAFLPKLNWWNGIADLAILLEPVYWPLVTNQSTRIIRSGTNRLSEAEENSHFPAYRSFALETAAKIPKVRIAEAHMNLRHAAGSLDDNHELYLLLRGSRWSKREKVLGKLGAAMWLRHIAEVLRHAYDELYDDRLAHEDEAFGYWYPNMREWAYGSEYPLENVPEMVRRILPHWGIAGSPRVRFYVEGETEEGALEAGLESSLGFGAEVVNLRAQGWGTWLRQELENDVAAKRLSLFMLDNDRSDAIRALKAHARDGLIVGMVFVNDPDFEIACFTKEELVKATGYYETEAGMSDLEPLKVEDFDGIITAKEFEERYCKLRIAPSLKGKAWGAALMKVAFDSKRGEANRLVHAWACASRAITTDYQAQKSRSPIDPATLRNLEVKEGSLV